MPGTVLVAEPNPQLRLSICASLQAEGLDVLSVGSLLELPRAWGPEGPDVLLLAGEMAENRARVQLDQFRDQGWRGALVLVGRPRHATREQLCPAHSLSRPLVMQDLLHWLELRSGRGRGGAPPPRVLQLEGCVVDLGHQTVTSAEGVKRLTTKEADFLAYLAGNPGRTVSRDELLLEVWGYRSGGSSRVVDKMLTRLRSKIGDDASSPKHIFTVYGGGYRFEELARVRPDAPAVTVDDSTLARLARGTTQPAHPAVGVPPRPRRPTTNLAEESTSFVGRADDLLDLTDDIVGGARLVSILGPGGAGKTRLALRFGELHRNERAPDGGVWFVDLTEARQLPDLLSCVCSALDLAPEPEAEPTAAIDSLGVALEEMGETLIILDNLEQLVEVAGEVIDRWLHMAPLLSFLVTTREPLRLGWERSFEIEPLALRDAVELFEGRAKASRRGFALREQDQPLVEAIVNAVDRLPLAIELAAARVTSLSLAQIAERLQGRMTDVLRSSRRDVSPRQATLWNAVDWSWELLNRWEQEALCQCAVFRGGFFLHAAESVVDLSLYPDAPPVLDAVEELVRKSLLRRTRATEAVPEERFALYAPIRDYAEQRLDERPEIASRVRARHRACTLAVGANLRARLRRGDPGEALQRLLLEKDNLLEVLRRAEDDDARSVVAAALSLDPLYAARGPASAHRQVLDRALESARAIGPDDEARVLQARGRARQAVEPYSSAEVDLVASLALARTTNDDALLADVACSLGTLRCRQGRWREAVDCYREALVGARALADRFEESRVLARLGTALQQSGRVRQAAARYREAMRLRAQLAGEGTAFADGSLILLDLGAGSLSGSMLSGISQVSLLGPLEEGEALGGFASLSHLWGAAMPEGSAPEVQRALELALAEARAAGDLLAEAMLLASQGVARLDSQEWTAAGAHFTSAVDVLRRIGHAPAEGAVLGQLGRVHFLQGRLDDAVDHFERSDAVLRRSGERRARAYVLAHLAASQADAGHIAQSIRTLARARQLATRVGDPLADRLIEVAAAHLKLSEGRAQGSEEADLLAATQARTVLASVAAATGSIDLRVATQLLRTALRPNAMPVV
ncbi:MAG: winged helix-turn-helix domain-containing protein [Deltaproteobacteria bacterium]|nr:winged helix-turn-helix domain-containing protein [Deltaproteobacteria bacterium]